LKLRPYASILTSSLENFPQIKNKTTQNLNENLLLGKQENCSFKVVRNSFNSKYKTQDLYEKEYQQYKSSYLHIFKSNQNTFST